MLARGAMMLRMAALAVMLALAGFGYWQAKAAQSARADAAAARAEAEGLREWARVQARELVAARAAAALDTELQQGDGADAPLSDYALRGAGRVWGGR